MSEKHDFLRFCGQLVFEEDCSAWDRFSPEQQEEFCILAQKSGWEMLWVRFLKDRLPEPYFRIFRNRYQKESVARLMESRDLKEFYQFLESEKIPYCPFKGADLAFRVYSDQTLRTHLDWDILFRQEDCLRLIRLLQEKGWQTFSGYDPKKLLEYHYERMHNEYNGLEIHWTLPHFDNSSPEELWRETEAVTEYQYVLTPEMNLLLLTAHAGKEAYTHVPQWKILLDAGMILKHSVVDWEKVHHLADHWKILRPDILLHVWSEFFPEGVLPPEDPLCEQQKLIREIFAMRSITQQYSPYEQKMTEHNIRWLLKRVRSYYPEAFCLKYHLQSHQKGKIILYGIWDILEKIVFYLTHSRAGKPELQAYYQKVAEIEKLVKHEK